MIPVARAVLGRRGAAVARALSVVLVLTAAFTALAGGSTQAPARRPSPPAVPTLYVLDGGILESDPARYRLTAREVATTELSVAAYLIVHPRGILMWDAGAVPDGDWTPTGTAVKHRLVLPNLQERVVTLRTPLVQQLTSIG